MEQKAKRGGRFNVVDIIAVVLILAVLAFAGYKMLGRGSGGDGAEQDMVKVTYRVKAEGVPAELYENTKKHLPSKLMASGELVGGEIVSVEKEPYFVPGPNGTWMEDPMHVSLIFTAETEAPRAAVMTTKVGEQEIRVGKEHIIKSEYVELAETKVVDVQWEE